MMHMRQRTQPIIDTPSMRRSNMCDERGSLDDPEGFDERRTLNNAGGYGLYNELVEQRGKVSNL